MRNFLKQLILYSILIFSLVLGITLVQAALNITCEAGGPYVKGSVVIVVGNVTNETGTAANVSVNITKEGIIKASRTTTSDSDGKYYVSFNEQLDIGNYTVNATAEKSGAYNSSNCSLEIRLSLPSGLCQNKNMMINGTAIYSDTGQLVSSGIVTASVLETNDKAQSSFTNGKFSLTLSTCVVLGRRYTLGIFVDDNAGKTSWSQMIFSAV